MSDQSRLRSGWRARRSRPDEPRSYRLANSVRLPVLGGLLVFLLLAAGTLALVGRTDGPTVVPAAVLDYQEAATRDAAQSVRRSVNEGIDDLEEMARGIGVLAGEEADLEPALRAVAETHGRYTSLYVVEPGPQVTATVGGQPFPDLVPAGDTLDSAGMLDARQAPGDRSVLIQQFASMPGRGAVIGHYDPGFLRFPLESARPGDAWVVNRDGRMIAALGGGSPFSSLPGRALQEAARRGSAGESGARVVGGGIDTQEMVAWSPVAGSGPAGSVGWAVVTSRRIASISLPATDARRQGILAGALVGVFALLIFGWTWFVVVKPLLRLQKEAERIAYGDLSRPVEVVRYDEIGLTARALERIRVLLIRRRVQGDVIERK
jgi:HAMP domain-containing protein